MEEEDYGKKITFGRKPCMKPENDSEPDLRYNHPRGTTHLTENLKKANRLYRYKYSKEEKRHII